MGRHHGREAGREGGKEGAMASTWLYGFIGFLYFFLFLVGSKAGAPSHAPAPQTMAWFLSQPGNFDRMKKRWFVAGWDVEC